MMLVAVFAAGCVFGAGLALSGVLFGNMKDIDKE